MHFLCYKLSIPMLYCYAYLRLSSSYAYYIWVKSPSVMAIPLIRSKNFAWVFGAKLQFFLEFLLYFWHNLIEKFAKIRNISFSIVLDFSRLESQVPVSLDWQHNLQGEFYIGHVCVSSGPHPRKSHLDLAVVSRSILRRWLFLPARHYNFPTSSPI